MTDRWLSLEPHERLIPAIDTTNEREAEQLIVTAKNHGAWAVKVGLELKTAIEYKRCAELTGDLGVERIDDLKLYGVSHTLMPAVQNLLKEPSRPAGMTVATQSGLDSLRQVQSLATNAGFKIFGVGHLTSIGSEETATYDKTTPAGALLKEAFRGADAGIEGMVCSGEELTTLKQPGKMRGMLTLVTGVRSKGTDRHEQKRVVTPWQAMRGGATAITMGRQLLQAEDQDAMYKIILREIQEGLNDD